MAAVPENQRVIGSKNVVQKPKRATPTGTYYVHIIDLIEIEAFNTFSPEPPKSRETGGKSDTQRRSLSNDLRKSTRL